LLSNSIVLETRHHRISATCITFGSEDGTQKCTKRLDRAKILAATPVSILDLDTPAIRSNQAGMRQIDASQIETTQIDLPTNTLLALCHTTAVDVDLSRWPKLSRPAS
jgi:hypothetical protein